VGDDGQYAFDRLMVENGYHKVGRERRFKGFTIFCWVADRFCLLIILGEPCYTPGRISTIS
jgi:hypothetical protein